MAARLVANYYGYRATLSVGFVTPIFTLFLLRTLSFTEVGALSALYSVVAVLGEVPTGYVGDRLGRRASLLLSVLFTVLSLAGFVVAQTFAWYLVLYVLWALALTFRSGSLEAWLYDVLDERLDSDDFTRVQGRGDAVQQWTSAVTMVGGGLLGRVSLRRFQTRRRPRRRLRRPGSRRPAPFGTRSRRGRPPATGTGI